ncbi:MAG: YeeE/YedE family protein [Dehalococcoidia bacterium]
MTVSARVQRQPRVEVPRNVLAGAVAAVAILGFGAWLMSWSFNIGAFWLIGAAFGIILQRSRLCFAGAFRDLIMSGDGRLMRAILVGLAVSTVGFGLLMARFVPDPSFGVLPPGAHIQPVGYATIVGGVIFGTGMVLAGGCVSGSLWRMGEGYVNSWVAMAGILAGLWLASASWDWWFDNDISRRDTTWLPGEIGMGWSIALTLAVLAALYLAILWWESRSPSMPALPAPPKPPALTFGDQLRQRWDAVFGGHGWPYTNGALALAVVAISGYALSVPLGVTGGLSSWIDRGVDLAGGSSQLPLKGSDQLAGCTPITGDFVWWTIRSATMTGLVAGAFVASTLSGEFKLRWSRQWSRYPQLLAGGLLMGYASVIAIGCTIGAFFSSIPSLAVAGWVFGIGLFAGAFIGVQIVRRLP